MIPIHRFEDRIEACTFCLQNELAPILPAAFESGAVRARSHIIFSLASVPLLAWPVELGRARAGNWQRSLHGDTVRGLAALLDSCADALDISTCRNALASESARLTSDAAARAAGYPPAAASAYILGNCLPSPRRTSSLAPGTSERYVGPCYVP